jgi:hypothetical protein
MPYDEFDVNTGTWATASTTTSTGQSDSDNLVNDIFKTLGDFVNETSPLFFLDSIQNLKTALEDFGQGMSAALACVSIDLQVISSGLSSAAVAYAATDKTLAGTFAQLETQLGYYTNSTVSGTTLQKATPAAEAALNTAYQQYYSSNTSTSSGFSLLNVHISPPGPTAAIPLVALVVIGIILLPIGV